MARSLKTKIINTPSTRSVIVTPIALGYGGEPALTLEFYDDKGRRHLVPLTDAQAAQVARNAARGFDAYAPDHPTVFDIAASRQRMVDRHNALRVEIGTR